MTQAAGRVHWIEGSLSIASFSSSIGVPAAIWGGYKLQAGPGRAGSGGAANFTVTGPQLERGEALCGLIPANGGEESWAFSPPLSAGRARGQRCCATVSKGEGGVSRAAAPFPPPRQGPGVHATHPRAVVTSRRNPRKGQSQCREPCRHPKGPVGIDCAPVAI